jgi:hypothetical protein
MMLRRGISKQLLLRFAASGLLFATYSHVPCLLWAQTSTGVSSLFLATIAADYIRRRPNYSF